ncbi:hypothetical protein C8J57DRAFT_1302350 [Mycena rebaudengoi]|nr:hypothetical protein C8J57DRAFT_1302350 [Mycena rebaudengoi]
MGRWTVAEWQEQVQTPEKDSKRYPEYVSSRYPSTEYDSTLPESEAFPLPGGRDRLTHQIDWSASNLYQNVTVVFGDHEEYDVLNAPFHKAHPGHPPPKPHRASSRSPRSHSPGVARRWAGNRLFNVTRKTSHEQRKPEPNADHRVQVLVSTETVAMASSPDRRRPRAVFTRPSSLTAGAALKRPADERPPVTPPKLPALPPYTPIEGGRERRPSIRARPLPLPSPRPIIAL